MCVKLNCCRIRQGKEWVVRQELGSSCLKGRVVEQLGRKERKKFQEGMLYRSCCCQRPAWNCILQQGMERGRPSRCCCRSSRRGRAAGWWLHCGGRGSSCPSDTGCTELRAEGRT
jgi:hypothetical protein